MPMKSRPKAAVAQATQSAPAAKAVSMHPLRQRWHEAWDAMALGGQLRLAILAAVTLAIIAAQLAVAQYEIHATSFQSPAQGSRGPAPNPGAAFSRCGVCGPAGVAGPGLWLCPFSNTFFIILTNRNHPVGNTSVLELRYELATLAAESVKGYNFLHVPGALDPLPGAVAEKSPPSAPAPVLNGIDVLARDGFQQLRGLRVGLITNASGIDRQGNATIDLLRKAPGPTRVPLLRP